MPGILTPSKPSVGPRQAAALTRKDFHCDRRSHACSTTSQQYIKYEHIMRINANGTKLLVKKLANVWHANTSQTTMANAKPSQMMYALLPYVQLDPWLTCNQKLSLTESSIPYAPSGQNKFTSQVTNPRYLLELTWY